ncbi:hypothetical protein [Halostella litorea]|uniref:hypothetical protein n=1 Tax=Halostella litorea TaxID=2528831 RepID=UPI001092882D|nr:hypothetical protein [Halostella litorea]
MSTVSVGLGAFALALLGLGYALAFRVETALALQERYAESVSWKPPSEDPEHYEDLREQRAWTFRLGGAVLLAVGTFLLAVTLYGTFFAASPG